MGIPIYFLSFSDKSGQTFVLLMKMSQFFQEKCKTKLYENSKKPGPSVRANFSEFYECPPTKIGLTGGVNKSVPASRCAKSRGAKYLFFTEGPATFQREDMCGRCGAQSKISDEDVNECMLLITKQTN